MSTSFPFQFVTLGVPVPLKIEANPDFPGETEPVCILTNLGPSSPDTFITVGPGLPPNGPDPWELSFHWATTGGPIGGAWQLDAFLESLGPPFGNVNVPGFPQNIPGGSRKICSEHKHWPVRRPLPGTRSFSLSALCDPSMEYYRSAARC